VPLPPGSRVRVKHTKKGDIRLVFAKGTNKVIEAKPMHKRKKK
jgi:hypothetical protein